MVFVLLLQVATGQFASTGIVSLTYVQRVSDKVHSMFQSAPDHFCKVSRSGPDIALKHLLSCAIVRVLFTIAFLRVSICNNYWCVILVTFF